MAARIFPVPLRYTEKILAHRLKTKCAKFSGQYLDESGWTKKRALAAAVRAFCKLDESTRADLYKKAYDKLK